MAIVSIQSHVSAGHVGNAAAVPALQALGRTVWPVQTVLFSNHPGHGAFGGQAVAPEVVADCLRGLAGHSAWPARQAVLSGYVGAVGTVAAIAEAVDTARRDRPDLPYLCDPVMGDAGPGLYVDSAIPAEMARVLIPRATLATPNRFELEVLTGRPCPDLAATVAAARALSAMGPPVVVVTSVDVPDGPEPSAARCLVTHSAGAWVVASPRLRFHQAPNGAGDLLSALMLHHWLLDPRPHVALSAAVSGLFAVLETTFHAGGRELALLESRAGMASPPRVWAPIRL